MSSPADRSPNPHRTSGKPSPEQSAVPTPSNQSADSTQAIPTPARQEPIPPPSHPKQYRAIGLVEGKYQPSQDKMTTGRLVASDGSEIEAVLLGKMISLIKNHVNLNENHLWVVYPRSLPKTDRLHLQIVGVWEPQTLSQGDSLSEKAIASEEESTNRIQNGYFSIRGEVVFASYERETAIVKIKQSPKNESDRIKFFKLKLKGTLPNKPVNHFWDLQVQLQGDTLVIKQGTDLGELFKKKTLPYQQRKRFSPQKNRRSISTDSRSTTPRKIEKPSLNRPSIRKPNQID